MICPNCGKINSFETDTCEKCNYNFAEINANIKCCRITSWVSMICLAIFVGFIILIAIDFFSNYININTSNIRDKITDIFIVIMAIILLLCPVIIIISRIRIALAQGRLYDYWFSTLIIAIFTIALILISVATSVSFYAIKFNTRGISRNFSEALQIYVENHNGLIPSDDKWINEIDTKTMNRNWSPVNPNNNPLANFAISSYAAGKKLSELPDNAVVAFETQKTLEHNAIFSVGIKPPKALEIYNDKYTGCTVIFKIDSHSQFLQQHDFLPDALGELNWMNTDKLSLPDTVNNYLSDKVAARLSANYIAALLALMGIVSAAYLFTKGFGLQTLLLIVISCVAGGYLGWLGKDLHYRLNDGLQVIYIPILVSAFIAAVYCLLIYKIKSRLSTGYLKYFISSTAMAAGVVSSTIVHLLFMLINYQWAPLALLCGLGWGIVGGGIMAIIANGFVFRRMLKWEPVVREASAEQFNEG